MNPKKSSFILIIILEVSSPANEYSEKEENLLLYDDLAKKEHLYPEQQSSICK